MWLWIWILDYQRCSGFVCCAAGSASDPVCSVNTFPPPSPLSRGCGKLRQDLSGLLAQGRRLGFISCLPRLPWWSQICGLAWPLTSLLFPSSSSTSFLASVWPIWPPFSWEEHTGRRECRATNKNVLSVWLPVCLRDPVPTAGASLLNTDPQDGRCTTARQGG